MKHYIRIGIMSFENPLVTTSVLILLESTFWLSSWNNNKRIQWLIKLLIKVDQGIANQRVKKAERKELIQIHLIVNVKVLFFLPKSKKVSLKLYLISEHLQDEVLAKLLGQFIKLHKNRYF